MKKIIVSTLIYLSCSSASSACTNDVTWYRQSAERIAINREVFVAAENAIKQQIASQHLPPKTWGVVLDIDETVLDNSAWNAKQCATPADTTSWDEFAATAQSTAIPGAVEFTNTVHQLGGFVNLISNRNAKLLSATTKNLQAQHIYFDQVLLDQTKKGTAFVDKNRRFNAVLKGQSPSQLPAQKIVAWLGDNIQDFPNFKQNTISKNPTSPQYNVFGRSFFVLPNPLYGSWQTH